MDAGSEQGEPTEIPIFELPLAILPTERLPLHIFEERYKRMIAHSSERAEPFGIVLRTDDGARSVGCAALVDEVIERFDDGRLNIAVEGAWRFRVLERWDGPDFPLALINRLPEPATEGAESAAARAAFTRLLEIAGAEGSPGRPGTAAFEIAGAVELPVEVKQELLETEREQDRLDLLTVALEQLADAVAASKVIAERAKSNGHGPPGGIAGAGTP